MSLTLEELRNKTFTVVRFREGYDEDEVDAFLDEVEGEMARLIRENESLRTKVTAAARAAAQNAQRPPAQDQRQSGALPVAAFTPPAPVPVGGSQPFLSPGTRSSENAVRVLELARHTADRTIWEARAEASSIVGEAHSRAESIRYASRSKAEALERDARERCQKAMAPLESARAALESQVYRLQSFEREYRSRVRAHLEAQMSRLEIGVAGSPQPAPAAAVHAMTAVPPPFLQPTLQTPWPRRGYAAGSP